jgi:hypothetical protein
MSMEIIEIQLFEEIIKFRRWITMPTAFTSI